MNFSLKVESFWPNLSIKQKVKVKLFTPGTICICFFLFFNNFISLFSINDNLNGKVATSSGKFSLKVLMFLGSSLGKLLMK